MRQIRVATVTAQTWVTPRMVRLTLAGDDLIGLDVRPAQDVEILLTDDSGHDIKRHYTIRRTRPLAGECDLDILIHADGGPGSRWAATAQVGEPVRFVGPRGKMELRAADWYLFAGDEASLPAIAALTEALDPRATTYVLAEVGADSDRVPVNATHLAWITRQGVGPGTCGPLAAALAALDRPAGVGQAYLLGESRVMDTLRGLLVHSGISWEHTFVKGYWNTDRRHPGV